MPEHAPGRTPGVGALLYHQVTFDVKRSEKLSSGACLVTSGLLLRGIWGDGGGEVHEFGLGTDGLLS